LASVDKYSRDALSGFNLQGFQLQKVDFLGCLSFFMAFVLSIVAVPFEDTLYYANARVPSWWTTASASSAFVSKLSSYHGVNAARAVFALLGYACVCATATPASLDVVQRAEELAKGAPNHFSSRSLGRDGGSEGRGQQRERAGDFVGGGGFERSDRRKFGGSIRNDVKQTSTPAMTTTFR
jgi:hypothetical protein